MRCAPTRTLGRSRRRRGYNAGGWAGDSGGTWVPLHTWDSGVHSVAHDIEGVTRPNDLGEALGLRISASFRQAISRHGFDEPIALG